MAGVSTLTCNVCGDGYDQSDFPLAARFDASQRTCHICLEPTHKYKNNEGTWKKCVIYFIDPNSLDTVKVRDLEGGTIHTIPANDVKTYNAEEEEEEDEEDDGDQEENDDQAPLQEQENDQQSVNAQDNVQAEPRSEDVQIISGSQIRALEAENVLDKKTADLLNRNISIYAKLKNKAAGVSSADFRMIYDATIISANYHENPPLTNKGDEKESFTELLYQEATIKPFTEKYPQNEQEYYKYSANITTFTNEHNKIPEPRLLEQVIKKCTDDERRRWNRWKENKAIEMLQTNDNQTKHQILQTLNAFKYYEAFIIRDLNITPNREKLINLLLYVRTGYNERPTSTYHRICTYLDQINSVIRNVNTNKVTRHPMKEIDTECINTLYKRVFLINNAEEQYGNDGRLNKKVREYLQRYINQHDFELKAFIRKLKAAEEHALPSGTEKPGKTGYVWQTYRKDLTIFQHKPGGNNRKRSAFAQPNINPRKRRKVTWDLKRCPFGTLCKFYINGNCKKYHTKEEVIKLNEKRIRKLEGESKAGRNNFKPFQHKQTNNKRNDKVIQKQKNKSAHNKMGTKPCRYAHNCRAFQNGNCTFKHNQAQKICSYCNKPGHLKYQCYSYKNQNNNNNNGDKKNKPEFRTYNPQQTPNPNPPIPYGNNFYTHTYPFTQPITDMSAVIPNQFMVYPQMNPIPNAQIPQPNALITNRINELQTALKDSRTVTDKLKKQIKQLEQQKDNNIYTQHARRS